MDNCEYTVYLGTYSEPILMGSGEVVPGKGKGLYLAKFDGTQLNAINAAPMVNPSYACVDPERQIIYAVNEQKTFKGEKGGGYTQIRYDDSGNMEIAGEGFTHAEDPCHIVLLPDKSFLSITNFSGQHVTFVPLDERGNICPDRSVNFFHPGSGPKPRQEKSHPHCTVVPPDSDLVYVADLGEDRLAAYRRGTGSILPAPEEDIHDQPGYGPRAAEFSKDGKHLYVICEIVNKVLHMNKADGEWKTLQEESIVPEGHTGWSLGADLHLSRDGKTLYASHRGSNTIIVFRVREDGSMEKIQVTASGGEIPRMFNITPDGKYLLCGNQDSDNIAVFEVDSEGKLTEKGVRDFPTPVFIGFI